MADNFKTLEQLCVEHGIDARQLPERAGVDEPRVAPLVRPTGSRAAGAIFAVLSRLAGVERPFARWEMRDPQTFENAIGELELDGRSARVTLRRSPRGDEGSKRLVVLHRADLALAQGERPFGTNSTAVSAAAES
jgi:hypothetical protein